MHIYENESKHKCPLITSACQFNTEHLLLHVDANATNSFMLASNNPPPHTFSYFSLPLISQLGLWHAPALFCVGRALSLMGVSWIDLLIPGSTRGHGFKGMYASNFSRFVPFSKRLSWFSLSISVVVIRELAGRLSEPPQNWFWVVGVTDGVTLYN